MGQIKLSSKEQNQMIETAVSRGTAKAVGFGGTDAVGCSSCIFKETCTAKHDRICMAHNRADRRSVYFIKATRDNGATGHESGKNGESKRYG